jgi:hypothetical protein
MPGRSVIALRRWGSVPIEGRTEWRENDVESYQAG